MDTIKKVITLTMILGCTAGIYEAHAGGFGLPSLGASSSKGAGNLDEDINKFNEKTDATNKLIAESAINIVSAVKAKEDGAELSKKYDAAKAITDPKERAAKLRDLTDVATKAAEAAVQNEDEAKIKKLSNEQMKSLAKSLFNFTLGVLQAKDLIPLGQSMISSASSNPMAATKLIGVKDSLSSIKGVIDGSATITTKLPKLFLAAGITPTLPTSSSDKAQVADLSS